jgi:aminocarboxymuconate-semialdehyde decarboxylase
MYVQETKNKDHGIDISVVSLANPWLDFVEDNDSIQMAALLNQDLQNWCLEHPRLYGFGVLPTLSIKGSIQEIERISSLSKIKGVIMGTHGVGKGLDDPELDPLFSKIEELGLIIFLHPHYGLPNEMYGEQENGHVLPLALGFPFETTIAISRLILTGIFDRLPNLKILLAHSGGTAPFLAGRLDSCVAHDYSAVASKLAKPPSEYLKNLYYDAISYHAPGLRCVSEFAGVDRILFGTDHPFFPPQKNCKEEWMSVISNKNAIKDAFNNDEVKKIMGQNALKILSINET